MNFPDKYDFTISEKKWQKHWQETGVYNWQDDLPRAQTFVIDTPPPTVSGILHMGHVFSYTQADFIARYQRMSGKDVFYPMGFDDNGLPTERLVEKVKKIRPQDVGREKFIEICSEVVAEAETEFEALFNSIALSVDWRQKYETISERSRKISQSSFLDLYNKGEVYRKLQPMFWDPVDQTAIAQAEVEDKQLESFENYLWFQVEGGEKFEVMTTRPEMLLACVAVMVHPDNFAAYKGKFAITPLFDVRVPFVADEKVDKEKGTGFVMCCTFGDETDIKWWREHNLEYKPLLNKYGKIDVTPFMRFYANREEAMASGSMPMSDYAQGVIHGQKASAAREKILQLLKEQGCLSRESKKIVHAVKCAERSGSPLEIMPSTQWFVKLVDKKDKLKEKINECNWFPDYMKVRAEQWNESLSWDWCISRQRYFGVPFPVWYLSSLTNPDSEEFAVLASPSQLPVNPMVDAPAGYKEVPVHAFDDNGNAIKSDVRQVINISTNERFLLRPDADVMDTWATSSVSPQLSSHAWVDSERHKKLFPADMRPQAHEIIRTWAYYTIAKAMLHENTVPWKNVVISGWCLAEDKSKMSKSKGNVITPVPMVESKSADVVRYWTSTSALGADTAYSEKVLDVGKKLINKLWNVCKFASVNLHKLKEGAEVTEVADKWIIMKLDSVIIRATGDFEYFEYSRARQIIEDFFWKDFCDNYLEICKARSYGETCSEQEQQSALLTIKICVEKILKLWAPFVPHITEELNSIIFGGESIHSRGSWPKPTGSVPISLDDVIINERGDCLVAILEEVRKFKSDKGVSIKFPIANLKVTSPVDLKGIEYDLKSVTSSEKLEATKGEFAVEITLGEQAAA